MTKENLKKCSFYIRVNNPKEIEYTLTSNLFESVDQSLTGVYNTYIDVNKTNTFVIDITKCSPESFIQIEKIVVNNVNIDNLNFVTNTNTHGFFNRIGKYNIKLRTNPISINFVNYMLSLSK